MLDLQLTVEYVYAISVYILHCVQKKTPTHILCHISMCDE